MMKRFILRSILFALALTVGYALLILIWGLWMPADFKQNLIYKMGGKGHMFSRMEEVNRTDNVDVLVIGSSLAMRGFDPRIFEKHGYKMFNLASGGQTPLQSEWLLQRYIDQLNPKLVILEVNPYVISRDGVESGLDLISNHNFEWSMVDMAFTINNIKVYNTLLYSAMRTWLGLNKNYSENKVKKDDTYVHGGFVQKQLSFFDKSKFDLEPNYDMQPILYQQEKLEAIIQLLASKNIQLLLIHPPVTKMAFDTYSDDKAIDNYFSDLGKYYNFNLMMEMNDTLDFYDSRHLNQNGVEVFNEQFIQEVLVPVFGK